MESSTVSIIILIIIVILCFLGIVPIRLLVRARASGVKLKISNLVGMKILRVSANDIVNTLIKATKAEIDLSTDMLVQHLAGGNISKVVDVLISAQKADIPLDYKLASAIDLAGRDVNIFLDAIIVAKKTGYTRRFKTCFGNILFG